MTARLHVFLGTGGVGKTTLAAGYALALARTPGRRVGLLGIDPSRRLKDALGLRLGDLETTVPSEPALRVAVLDPAESMRRWAAEASSDPPALERLLHNAFFLVMADRLATATDVFAAARVGEWVERDPELTDLVIDTAPGLNAIEFLTRPERVSALLGGRLVGWLRRLGRDGDDGSLLSGLRGVARRALAGLDQVGGTRLLADLAEFFSLVEGLFTKLLARVQYTDAWLRDPSTNLFVVAAIQDEGGQAEQILAAVRGAGLACRALIVNRTLPAELMTDLAALGDISLEREAGALVRYARAYAGLQARILAEAASRAPQVLAVPVTGGLDSPRRLDVLADLGRIVARAQRSGPRAVGERVALEPRSHT